ncbi:hypothetical protein EVAR_6806_1 [Eumeta japonica]|uniref:Uncharacterized protein n=1 Tax=Eumeta variegata TaxID=151549 RepID=A0A4C1U7B7_EUMVA|nr:hypothetical protein EVAR_6806_1 [Eumeta japonica]
MRIAADESLQFSSANVLIENRRRLDEKVFYNFEDFSAPNRDVNFRFQSHMCPQKYMTFFENVQHILLDPARSQAQYGESFNWFNYLKVQEESLMREGSGFTSYRISLRGEFELKKKRITY